MRFKNFLQLSPAGRLECKTNLSEPVEAVCTLEQEGGTCIEEIQDSKSPVVHRGRYINSILVSAPYFVVVGVSLPQIGGDRREIRMKCLSPCSMVTQILKLTHVIGCT